ncbi:MAG: hypothetical protein NXI04_19450 [Planctomycetaceae bacterium]|nr:hypothetical protein [Planctomycetaceae bacterium]
MFRYSAGAGDSAAALRIYSPETEVDLGEPEAWSIADVAVATSINVHSVRLITGPDGHWQFDELKIGTSWAAVLPSTVLPAIGPADDARMQATAAADQR